MTDHCPICDTVLVPSSVPTFVFEADTTHFDTNHSTHVLWDEESPADVAEELVATIRSTLPAEAKLSDS